MDRKKQYWGNTALLTGSSLLMSAIGMMFQAWLVGRIGSAGIGLYQLTISVNNLLATVAISGIRFASTRLISEELGLSHTGSIRSAMRRCLAYALFWGGIAAAVQFLLAKPIAFLGIRDARTVPSLQLSAISMPCISLCSSLSGYFTACGRVWKPTLVHFLEQVAGIVLVALFLRHSSGSLTADCAAVTLGRALADVFSLLLMLVVYLHDRLTRYPADSSDTQLTRRMLGIAMPLAASAYARSALTTLRQLLVPRGLRAAGLSANAALSGYGVLQGMVLPILFFPSCILSAAAELIVPELTGSQVRRDLSGMKNTAGELLRHSLWYSLAVGTLLLVFSDVLCMRIYHSYEAGKMLRLLAPLVPVMYMDMTVDGCLKGSGQQVWSMGINIVEGLLGLMLVILLLPHFGLNGYLSIFYVTEVFNFVLSFARLRQVLNASASGGRRPCASKEKSAYTAKRSAPIPPRL